MSTSNKALGFLCRICKDFQDEAAVKSLYYSFVFSKLSYGSVVWSPYYNVHKLRFERLQNKLIVMNCYDSPELLSLVHFHVPQRQTRNRQLFHNRSFRTNVGRNSPVTRMCDHFNKYVIDLNIFIMSLLSFKKKCKEIFCL
ncbi:uncharacterized protein LOC123319527 [Coccinella septempunctata]|uniref:uncharacterized protein LOC123308992 n=1 Tax=Coccinella septempunctata TaxID=41139 RepID=UPI001D08C0B1|nr:uncharacterized protein LOC123308992 [Coccinella septempunctata]XP_044762494.1 uncharacterized protein LOC123319527 [Coccinella septempunctata]